MCIRQYMEANVRHLGFVDLFSINLHIHNIPTSLSLLFRFTLFNSFFETHRKASRPHNTYFKMKTKYAVIYTVLQLKTGAMSYHNTFLNH